MSMVRLFAGGMVPFLVERDADPRMPESADMATIVAR
jgi:hypothetical protein